MINKIHILGASGSGTTTLGEVIRIEGLYELVDKVELVKNYILENRGG